MEKGFEFFEHTADIGFYSEGKNIDEAFENAGRAFLSVLTDEKKVGKTDKRSFEITSEDSRALLYDFLDHLVFLKDTENFLIKDFDIRIEEKKDGFYLECQGKGQKVSSITGTDVKAATYSEMDIKKKGKDKVVLKAVLDI